MHTGKIKKLVREKNFGFISETDGKDVFFHQSSLVDVQFSDLNEGQEVTFEVEKTEKGPRATSVRVSPQA